MNIKKLAVDAAIQASAPTPPDTATDAGRVGKVVAYTVDGFACKDGDEPFYYAAEDYQRLASDLDAVTAERGALQKQVERLKTVPMKYRRMEFNAQLQNQLAAKEKECERLREVLVEVQAARYREQGMKVEQSYIHAKCDVDRERIRFAREALATGGSHD